MCPKPSSMHFLLYSCFKPFGFFYMPGGAEMGRTCWGMSEYTRNRAITWKFQEPGVSYSLSCTQTMHRKDSIAKSKQPLEGSASLL